MTADLYLVWSNEHRSWWRPNSYGYTVHVEAAGRYSREEAIDIARGARNGWPKGGGIPCEIAVPERDVLDMQRPTPPLPDAERA